MLFFDIQIVSMVFLLIVSDERITAVLSFIMLIPDVFLSKQSRGQSGLVWLRRWNISADLFPEVLNWSAVPYNMHVIISTAYTCQINIAQ